MFQELLNPEPPRTAQTERGRGDSGGYTRGGTATRSPSISRTSSSNGYLDSSALPDPEEMKRTAAEDAAKRSAMLATALAASKQESVTLKAEKDAIKQKKAIASAGHSSKLRNFSIKRRLHPREVDELNMGRAREMFKAAGLEGHIRKGDETDLACVMPSLIPVPGAFQSDGRNPLSSYTGENIIWNVKKNMILGDLGYIPQKMIPLYARLTLIEENGTSPGGDQNFEVWCV